MKLKLHLAVWLLVSASTFAQSFYDTNTIQEIRIYFSQPDWETQLNVQQMGEQQYIPAESVAINGTVFENVGVKYKGNSSFIPWHQKNPFHIELDTYQDQDYQGYTDIKLSNVIFDPSYVRETLSYDILGQYMAAPQCNYANVYVNDVLRGLYVNVESISKKFVRKHFHSDGNAFFECSPVNGASGTTTFEELPTLLYWGNNINSYNLAYEIKSDEGWEDLIALTQTLNHNTPAIENVLDVDRALWMLAYDNLMVNIDSYIGIFSQNYYLYKDDNGRFNPVVWDLNMSLGVFADLGTSILENTQQKKTLSPFQHLGDNTFPLVFRLLNNPHYRKVYLAHYYTMLQENFANNSYWAKAQAMHDLIDASVQAEPNPLNSYAAFQANMTTDLTTNNGLVAPGISNLVNGRTAFLQGLPDFSSPKPTITNLQTSPAAPVVGNTVHFTAHVTNTNTNAVTMGFRHHLKDVFVKTPMFDDGAHNDGAAGDNVYGASVVMTHAYLQYYLYAENNTIGAFSPARAEYEFHELDATYPTLDEEDLVINELMAQNTSTVTDPAGQFEDWIELYNNTANTISLDNLYLTDSPDNLQKWAFPSGLTMAPHSYLIVWADEDLTEEGLHADFKLSANGESIILSYPNGAVVDAITFGAQTANVSYARVPNGTGDFFSHPTTFNENNENLGAEGFASAPGIVAWPNPANDVLAIRTAQPMKKVSVFNLMGQVVFEATVDGTQQQLPVHDWASGVYIVKVTGESFAERIKITKR
ncbi:CotH kinase family protein [Flavobacterium caeni]|uniref:Por secretion system C-terminal sorting domain-containing protein n=1 Tax=Flavobacterium caeni TaxID=490189 RepID=A0A1G5EPP5_9FLAO|nr:CotH kinase family protein [Flavobacterium caeni]SCY28985.1 Por secretion system C-terminal sorting domain-containing protein [Flavobacterium caeni]